MTAAIRVLIADDEPLIRETLAELLVEEGFEVIGRARDGEEAIRMVAELDPDVVLIDVRMPVVNGIEATRRILENGPRLVIALSAYDDPALASAARNAGAVDYVAKGTPSRELIGRIRDAVGP